MVPSTAAKPIVAPPEPKYLAVYGTLKKGFGAHDMLMETGAKFAGDVVLPGLLSTHYGRPYPLYLPIFLSGVHVELYEVNNDVLRQCDQYEGVPTLYKRIAVHIAKDNARAWIYQYADEKWLNPEREVVLDGRWRGSHADNFVKYSEVLERIKTRLSPPSMAYKINYRHPLTGVYVNEAALLQRYIEHPEDLYFGSAAKPTISLPAVVKPEAGPIIRPHPTQVGTPPPVTQQAGTPPVRTYQPPPYKAPPYLKHVEVEIGPGFEEAL